MVTATLFAPAAPAETAGVSAVMVVVEVTFSDVASKPPTVTLVAPVRFAPVIVITVPPRVEPEVGATDVIVGGTT